MPSIRLSLLRIFLFCIKIQDTLLELAIPTQNLEKRSFNQTSVQSMPINGNCMSWNPNKRQISLSSSKDVSFKVDLPRQLRHDAKHLGLQVLPDHPSCTTRSIVPSQDQCLSSESGIFSWYYDLVVVFGSTLLQLYLGIRLLMDSVIMVKNKL